MPPLDRAGDDPAADDGPAGALREQARGRPGRLQDGAQLHKEPKRRGPHGTSGGIVVQVSWYECLGLTVVCEGLGMATVVRFFAATPELSPPLRAATS